MRRQVAGENGHGGESNGGERNRQRVVRLEAEEHRARGFSQGQRVKTAIARALIHDPRNVILDEPTNGLDVMATRALRQFTQDSMNKEPTWRRPSDKLSTSTE